MNLTPESIAQITTYLDATTPLPDHADLTFVFGTRLLTPGQIVLDLYSFREKMLCSYETTGLLAHLIEQEHLTSFLKQYYIASSAYPTLS